MLNIKNQEKKKIVNSIFIAMLLLVISFSFSLDIGEINLSFSGTGIAAAIILMVSLNKYRKENAKFNNLFYASLVYIFVLVISPLVMYLVLANHLPNFDYIIDFATQLETTEQLNFDDLNHLFEFISSLKEPIFVSLMLGIVFNQLPLYAMVFLSSKALLEISNSVESSYGKEIKKYSNRSIITSFATSLLSVAIVLLVFEGLSGILFTYDGDVIIEDNVQGLLTASGAMSIALGVISIMYLVYYIKFLIRINKLSSDINVNQDNTNEYQG